MNGWPAVLRLQTRKILDGIDTFPIGDILPMKNIGKFSAYLMQADLSNGQIILYDAETQLTTCFQSAGELFDAGWIADLQPASQFPLLLNTAAQGDLPTTVKNLSPHTVDQEVTKVVHL